MQMRVKPGAGSDGDDREFFNQEGMAQYRGKVISVTYHARDNFFPYHQETCTENCGHGWCWRAEWLEKATEYTNEEMLDVK